MRVLGTSIGTGVRYSFSDTAVVLPSAEIVSADDFNSIAIFGHNSDPDAFSPEFDLSVYGTVISEGHAISVDDTIVSARIVVGRTGLIAGGQIAINIDRGGRGSDTVLQNNGEIIGNILYDDYPYTYLQNLFLVSNTGLIDGSVIVDSGIIRLTNSGSIMGGMRGGIYSDAVTNTGTITGNLFLNYGDDRVINRGEIIGSVYLGPGNDLYDGRHGFVAEMPQNLPYTGDPCVYGDEGNDTFINSSFEDSFDGGNGVDTLRFDGSNAAIVFLDGNEGGGSALGDVYRNIENVVGSATGADIINGSTAGNTLNGRGGNDVLRGLGGADQLIGGVGIDSLSGGSGSDYFTFFNISEGGDKIADFSNVSGNNDSIRISASGFGLSLPVGQLAATYFRSGTTNLAQDADDRFVFRTTDKTLWFDADGRGGAAPTLIADLQDNATFNQTDILIF